MSEGTKAKVQAVCECGHEIEKHTVAGCLHVDPGADDFCECIQNRIHLTRKTEAEVLQLRGEVAQLRGENEQLRGFAWELQYHIRTGFPVLSGLPEICEALGHKTICTKMFSQNEAAQCDCGGVTPTEGGAQ